MLAIDALGLRFRDLLDEYAMTLREGEGELPLLHGGGGLELLRLVHDFCGVHGLPPLCGAAPLVDCAGLAVSAGAG